MYLPDISICKTNPLRGLESLKKKPHPPRFNTYCFSTQPRSQGLFPGLGAGREKALGSAGHMILGVLNYHMLKRTFQDGGPFE